MFDQSSTQPIVPAHHCSDPVTSFESWLAEFDDYMLNERGLSVATRRGRRSVIHRFLSNMVAATNSPASLTITDVDAFLQSLGEQGGYSRVSLQMIAGCLRAFFRYGATRGWCRNGLAEAIHSPRVYSLDSLPSAPSWEDVKQLLALTEGDGPTDIRDRAILMLLAMYGLRAGEAQQLRLEDFDWEKELLSVRCSKTRRGRVFPLSRPVGDAVLRYITQVRPRTSHREVFLTLHGPIRPVRALWAIVAKRLRQLGVNTTHHGPHALRHACATHLQSEGLSLKQIGDHLGHCDPDATRIYAKVDIAGLRKVGDVDLGGLL
jgi:integrase/recombinase XerD